ncbi:MAG: 8-oxo-dGTP pyrophosphatase MutT (NUDIX family) [Saprospiraceae bacterium]|jgi:8-oxo-dGTP pyrophosphatase MutT (NUDIX family)
MKKEFIEDIRKKLQGELPGQEAQYKMTHAVRRTYKPAPDDARVACVMCLFYEKNNEAHVAFIQRTSKNPNDRHGGQIGFPGGKAEEFDSSHEETARRETEEEIGIKGTDIDVLGALTPLYIPVSNFQVYPFVGYLDYEPKFIPQIEEVDGILEISFSIFSKEKIRKTKDMRFGENVILKNVPYFDLGGHVLWGATAMMMSELLVVVE